MTTPPPRWTRRTASPTLGVVMIVRDEAERLPALLAELTDLADEVVVVDTGSTDATPEICRRWGVTLVHRPWRDDFAYARNQAIEQATARHLLWLDGDDRVPAEAARALARLRDEVLPRATDRAYSLQVRNVDARGDGVDSFRQVRIFPNRTGIRYRGAVHESFMESLRAEGVRVEALPIAMVHTGYATPEAVRRKAERNAALLRRQLARDPDDVQSQVYLARSMANLGEVDAALKTMDGVLARAGALEGHAAMRAELHLQRAHYRNLAEDAPGAARDLDAARRLRPEWGVPAALRLVHALQHEDAAALERIVDETGEVEFSAGAFGYPLERLEGQMERCRGRVALGRGRLEEGIRRLRRALEVDPRNADARLDLGQALLDGGDPAAAHPVLEPLASDEAILPRFFDACTAIGLARAATGDLQGAAACLAPLVEFLAEVLPHPDDASPGELAEAFAKLEMEIPARNMAALDRVVG